MNRVRRRYFFWAASVGSLVLAALGAAAGFQLGIMPNPVFRLQIRADVGTWVLIGGAALTLGLVFAGIGYEGVHHLLQRSIAQVQRECSMARRRFLRRLDHELKNHLAVIRAQLGYLAEGIGGNFPERVLRDMLAEVERLSRLTAQLRKLAELEEQAIEYLPVDVALLLKDVVEASQAHPHYETRRVRLLLPQAPWPLPPVNGDRDLLWLALFNVLDNALKFTRPGDLIELRAFEDGRSVVIEIADTGPGIAEEDLPYIFEELYRGANAQGHEGSGLGLALVQTIVKRHQGTIRVRSRPGQGTVFTLRLPVAS